MLRPMLLVLLELENSLSKAVRIEQASVCCRGEGCVNTEVRGYTKSYIRVTLACSQYAFHVEALLLLILEL